MAMRKKGMWIGGAAAVALAVAWAVGSGGDADESIPVFEVAEDGMVTGFRMRCEKSKLTTVRALQSIGFDTIAAGDSFNDLGMIQASKAGFLFRSTEAIRKEHPELEAFEEYDDLLAAIRKAL